jgi:uncharacterized membrane protein YkoI
MKTIFLYLSLTLLLFSSTTLFAANDGISKQQAMDIATRAHPGRVLSVKRDEDVYKIKTLSDKGKVRIVVVDVRSGKILSGR